MTDLFERISRLSPQRLALLVMDLQSKLDAVQRARQEPIAIVGMSCRIPGGVDSPEGFWQLLVNGVDAITEVPAERWSLDIPEFLGRRASGDLRGYWGGFVDGIDQFDAQFFGIVPREAVRMDPQQRMLLEVAWEALERAGIAPDRLTGTQTGVYIGQNSADYGQVLLSAGLNAYDLHSLMGSMPCITAGRISYVLGLQGPNLALDTGCSSSLVALHLAVQSLRSGECNLALAGGVNAILTPSYSVAASRAEVLAPDGRCKTFDAAANGYVRSDGCGVVVLKRLSDAQADGDTILAIVRGTAVNQDGRSNGLTAPNGPSQTEVIRAALASGGVDPRDVTYVEAHGTGTPLGDPIEAQALGAALGEGRSADQPIWIGSVKTNIGHLEAAAGVAGLIKLVLSLQHGQIPPSLNFTEPSPHIPWDTLPLQVPTSVQPWDSADRPRIGGVSSFGLSGTNAHAVVEAAPFNEPGSNECERPLHILPLSAKTETALADMAARYRAHLSGQPAATADIAYSAGVGRSQFPHRLAVIGNSVGELDAGLETYLHGVTSPTVLRSRSIDPQTPKVAFLFTGLGSQFVGMGRQLYETQPTFRAALEQCQELLRPRLEQPLLSVLYPDEGVTSRLEDRAYGLPVVFAFEYALAQLWRSWGIEPSYVLGHSLGEYVAACVAGVFSLEDGLRLSAERARLVSTLPSAGQMVSVLAPEAQIASIIADFPEDVSIAAINGPESVVVAGQSTGFQTVLERFREADLSVRTLAIPFAAHSPTLEPMLDPFEQFAASIRYAPPRLDLVSGRTGRLAGEHELTNATYWRRHLRETVRFADAVETLYAQGCRHFVEIGSAPVLLGLAQQSILDPDTVWLPSLDPKRPDWDRLLESLGTLFTRGVDVDWAGFDRDYNRQKVVLPTYPFQRERVWIDSPTETPRTTVRACDAGLHPLLGQRLRSPLVEDHQFEAVLSAERPAFLTDHRIFGQASLPAAGFIEAGLAAAAQVFGAGPFEIEQLSFQKPLFLPNQQERTVQVVLTPSEATRADMRIYSTGDQQATWTLNATGTVLRAPSQPSQASPASLLLDTVQARCSQEAPGEDIYARFAAAGIEFGPRFRGLTRLWKGVGEALGQIDAPGDLAGDLGSYTLHPALLDACFHALEAALPDERPPLTYLTIGLDRIRVLGAPSNRLWSHVKLRPDSPADSDSFICDLDVYDEQLRLVIQIEGVLLQGASREALRQRDEPSLSDSLYEVQWRSQQRPTSGDCTPAAEGEWLIFSDADGVGNHLASVIAAQGGRSTLVVPGRGYGRVSSNTWTVDPASEHDVELLLDDVRGRKSQPLRIVHLWGLRVDGAGELHSDALDDAATLTVASALHLTKALAARSGGNAGRLWYVTRNVQPIGAPGAPEVAQAPLWGLGRVIAIEQPDIWGGLIDLGSSVDGTRQAADLLAEMLHAGEDQVALRGSARYVARLVSRGAPSERSVTVHRDGAYLIVGGLGGIGLAVARQLAEQGAGHLALQGRRGLPDRETWDYVPADSPTYGQIAAVREIEALGTSVTAVAADISDRGRMSDVMALFGTELPALRGVIHSAAALDDSVLTQSSWPRFRQAMRAKVDGAWILHELTRQTPLDFFVLFSSVASLIASPGLGNYAASNAFLDTLAQYRRQCGLPGLTINWGVWEGIGITAMADVGERVAERMSSGGLNLIPVRDGVAIFQRLLASDAAQIMVSPVQWPTFLQQFPPESAPPFYSEIARPAPRRDGPLETVTRGTLGDRARASAVDDREQLLAIGLREILAEVAELGPPEELALDVPLQQFGVDSLVAVQLRNRITSEVGLTVPISSLIGGSSLAELAVLLRDRLEPISSVQTQHVTALAPTKEPTDWSSHVAELSEEELDLLLMEMLASEKGDS